MSLPRSDHSQETTRSVPPPTDDAIDVIVDAVSGGARISRAASSADESTSAVTLPQTHTRSGSLLVRRSAALLLAFAIGLGLAIWSLRALDPSRPESASATSNARPEAAPPPLTVAPPAPPILTSRDLRPLAALAFSVRAADVTDIVVGQDALADASAPTTGRTPIATTARRNDVPPVRQAARTRTPAIIAPAPVDATPEPLDSVAPTLSPSADPPAASVDRDTVDMEAVETDAVRGTIDGYARALERLDVRAAAMLWPTVDRRALERAFSSLNSQDVAVDECDVALENATATARCQATTQYVVKVGAAAPRTGRFEWLFRMRKHADAWKIEQVSASQVGSLRDQQ